MRAGPLLITALLGLAALPGTSLAATPSEPGLEITHTLTADGWPSLAANYAYATSSVTPTWARCGIDSCDDAGTTNPIFLPGPSSEHERFQASGSINGAPTTAVSKEWLGQVTNLTPPALSGATAAGATVTATGGTWAGGWPDDFSLVQLRACPTPAGTGCVRVANGASAVVDAAYAGWYLGAMESRYGTEQAFAAIGYLYPPGKISSHAAAEAGRTVALGPLSGPVTVSPKAETAPPQPALALRKAAVLRKGSLVLGTLSCAKACKARVEIRQGSRTAVRRLSLTAAAKTTVTVPARRLRRTGKLRVAVTFSDGTAALKGTLRAKR